MKLSRKIFSLILMFLLGVSLGGCNIPFERFADNNTEQEKDIDVPSLNMSKEVITSDNITDMDNRFKSLFSTIANKTFYIDNYYDNSKFFEQTSKYFTQDYYDKIKSNDFKCPIKKAIDNIYYKKDTEYSKEGIIDAGEKIDLKGNITKHYTVQVIAVDNTNKFQIETIKLYVDDDNRISNAETVEELKTENNTTTPLSSSSLLSINNKEFDKALHSLFTVMHNPTIYGQIISKGEASSQIDTLLSYVKIQNKDIESIKNLFMAGRGTFDKYSITEYHFDDVGSLANSEYILTIPNGNKVQKFSIIYSRATKEITKITYIH